MFSRSSFFASACAGLLATAGLSAHAASFDVDLAGWIATEGYADPANTSVVAFIPAGSLVTGFDYIDLTFEALDDSWASDFTLSVNATDDPNSFVAWLDWVPVENEEPGKFGPISGSWVDDPSVSFRGAPWVDDDGKIFVTTYLQYTDASVGVSVSAGTLRVYYTPPIPEPGTYAMMALGLLAVGAAVRRGRG